MTTETKKTGTKEWADTNFNIGAGCSHNCAYCYAAIMAVDRFERVKDWSKEQIRDKIPRIPPKAQRVMFPTSHDISPFYLPTVIDSLHYLLRKGKKVLLVTKPHLPCIQAICKEFSAHKDSIEIRCTIGTLDESIAKFWEPGAPTPSERVQALDHAIACGFACSVSMEPILDTVEEALHTFKALASKPVKEAWIGLMNRRYFGFMERRSPELALACTRIRKIQCDSEVERLAGMIPAELAGKLKWKNSISEILDRKGLA